MICLGCGGMAGLEEQVRAATGVPVVDGVPAAVTVAESLVRLGLTTSKARTYAAPRSKRDHRIPAGGRMSYDLVVRGRRIMTTAGEQPREVGVTGGRIVAIEPLGNGLDGTRVLELGDDEVLLPGLVDTHVHVNEPGRTEWEGFASATRAAAAGGVTTIVDMPLNSIPPTVDVAALEVKRKVAGDQAFVDVGFWGGAVPGNQGDLRGLHDEGVFGFKCFLLHSGVDEFPPLDADGMEARHGRAGHVRRADDRARGGLAGDRQRAVGGRGAATARSSRPARAAPRTWPSPR